jgi:hypothetical protein
MGGSQTWNLEGISHKCSSYWRSVLFFGLPFTILYRGIDYLIFCITTQNSRFVYPWSATLKWDIFLLFVASFIWWALMRQLVSWKRKYYAGNQTPGSRH